MRKKPNRARREEKKTKEGRGGERRGGEWRGGEGRGGEEEGEKKSKGEEKKFFFYQVTESWRKFTKRIMAQIPGSPPGSQFHSPKPALPHPDNHATPVTALEMRGGPTQQLRGA